MLCVMTKLLSPLKYLSIALLLLASTVVRAESVCAVPVCDIPTEVEALKGMTQTQRYKRVNELRGILKTKTDIQSFTNLRDFALKARALFVEIKEEDWVIREPSYLVDESVQKILITEEPNAEEMKNNFILSFEEGARYSILNYWSQAAQKMENVTAIKELLTFSEFAEKYCADRKDSDYVPREALNLRRNTTARYMVIYPSHEGVYEVTGPNFLPTRLIVVETMTSSGLLAVFSDSKNNTILFDFPGLRASGDLLSLEATNTDTSIARSVQMRVNVSTGEISGVIRDSRGIEPEQVWIGKRLFSPVELFPKAGSSSGCEFSENTRWTGSMGDYPGELTIRKINDDKYAATFTSKTAFVYRIDFSVIYLKNSGVLYLTYNGANANFLKLTLACKDNAWDGTGFSTMGGTIFSAHFQGVQ